jgi:hypothetical protein
MKLTFRNLAILGLSTSLITGCTLSQMIKMAKDQKLTVAPNPLEVHGESTLSILFTKQVKLPNLL